MIPLAIFAGAYVGMAFGYAMNLWSAYRG